MKIGIKIFVAFLVVVFVAAYALFMLSTLSERLIEKAITNNFMLLAREVLVDIEEDVNDRLVDLRWQGHTTKVQDALMLSHAYFENTDDLQRIMQEREARWRTMGLEETATFIDPDISEELRKKIMHEMHGTDQCVYEQIMIVNKYGFPIAQAKKSMIYQQRPMMWWSRVRQEKVYVGPLSHLEGYEDDVVPLAIRIDDEHGDFQGAVYALLNVHIIENFLKDIKKRCSYKSSVFYLTMADGDLLTTTKEGSSYAALREVVLACLQSEEGTYCCSITEKRGKKSLLPKEKFTVVRAMEGIGMLTNLQWYIIGEYDRKELFAPVNDLQQKTVLVSLVVIFLGMIVGTGLSSSLSYCFGELVKVVERVGKGDLNVSVSIDEKNEFGHLAKAFTDMTYNLKTITASRDELNAEVDARRRTETALKKAKRDAEKALVAKSEFLATMSHEIRTPMNGILGFLALLQKTPLTDMQQDYVDTAIASGRVLSTIINDILDIAKLESGEALLENVEFDLPVLLEDVMAMFRPHLEGKQVSLRSVIESEVPRHIESDPVRLRQILINLVNNAIKFTTEGEVLVSVRKEMSLTDGRAILCFCVADTGIGIADEQQESIFQAFTQGDMSSTRSYEGTGLGLSICRAYVEMMQGTIKVKSTQGKGSQFSFTINIRECDIAVDWAADMRESKKKVVANTCSDVDVSACVGVKVLVVEDNVINQKVLHIMLERLGCICTIVNNGREAIEQLTGEERYDVVLMDVLMPEMDGCEATQVIRDKLNLPIPIIALSAAVLMSDQQRCYSAGMNDFLMKPINVDELTSKLIKWTKGKDNS